MSKDVSVLKKLPVVQLKRILTDYNKKLQKKEYKGVASMKKNDIIEELRKMYTWKHNDKKDKISFLRKGKQHSFVLGIRGVREANQDYEERMQKKKDRKKAISKVLIKKKVNIPKEHIKHHSKSHIDLMRKEMKKGKSFKEAHELAVKKDQIKKEFKQRDKKNKAVMSQERRKAKQRLEARKKKDL